MGRRRAAVVAVLTAGVLVVGCSSDPSDDSPGLDRIDGPARVDPSFDPFETVPVTDGG
jgi:hypothetical protein